MRLFAAKRLARPTFQFDTAWLARGSGWSCNRRRRQPVSANEYHLFRARHRQRAPVNRLINDLAHPLKPPIGPRPPNLSSPPGTAGLFVSEAQFHLSVEHICLSFAGNPNASTWTKTVHVKKIFKGERWRFGGLVCPFEHC